MGILATNLKRIRKEKGLNQEELASKVGVSYQYISNAENSRMISLSTVAKICTALEIHPASLFMTEDADLDLSTEHIYKLLGEKLGLSKD